METDVLIVGAGAAGLMCAAAAGARGRRVVIVEHTDKIAEKIRISGGGRCNFTNLNCAPGKYSSQNPHFCTSALKRYTQQDFIGLVESHGIPYHEKTLGQLFCDRSAQDIIQMLLDECKKGKVDVKTSVSIERVTKLEDGRYLVATSKGDITATSLVIASGGLSIPKIGATPFGYEIARQFGLSIIPLRAGLVPLTFDPALLVATRDFSGLSIETVRIKSKDGTMFEEAMLFTHRGISGPAVLQISSYWNTGEDITVNMSPATALLPWLKEQRMNQPKSMLQTILAEILPKRLAQGISDELAIAARMADLSDKKLQQVATRVEEWKIRPSGSEGYRTAEVTMGGVDTDAISSKNFECKTVPGLYFIGEALDVTGHLGGYNFQWAWSSGWCAGQYV